MELVDKVDNLNVVCICSIMIDVVYLRTIITSSKTTVLLRSSIPTPPPFWLLLQNCCTILALPIESEIMDGFWCSRCLNDRIEVPDMIRSFASGATASLVAKNRTKKISQPFEDGFWCSRCLNDRIKVPDMMRSFASSATASMVAKKGTKKIIPLL